MLYTQALTAGLNFTGFQQNQSFSNEPTDFFFVPVNVPPYTDVRYYTGDPDIPWEIRNLRLSTADTMRYVGTPALIKRMYTAEDVELGIAQFSPMMDQNYNQSMYYADVLSHGVGYVSVDTQDGEWYDPQTGIVYVSPTIPSPTYLPAPRYRGYGPGFLAYVILPDRPEDNWKLTPQGTLVRQQTAMAQLPWWPQVGDNDLLITCRLNGNGQIAQTYERYQLKQVSPISMRGMDRLGNREFEVNAGGNRYWIGQQCELTKVPTNDSTIYTVETDR